MSPVHGISRSRKIKSDQFVDPADDEDENNELEILDKEKNDKNENTNSPSFSYLINEVFIPLETIARTSGNKTHALREKRSFILQRFINHWKLKVDFNLFPAFRLIVPSADKSRVMYGIKEKIIGQLFISTLKIAKNSPDAQEIINYKIPLSGGALSLATDDLASRIYRAFLIRVQRNEFSSFSINDINSLLDSLGQADIRNDQLKIIETFTNSMNALEIKWIVRIILKQMHIATSVKSLLYSFHPQAFLLYSVTSNLSRVCNQLSDKSYRLPVEFKTAQPLSCFSPQIAIGPIHSFDIIVNKFMLNSIPFYIEPKLDGERMQMHYVDYGSKIRFFSRNAKDYTYLYGSSINDISGPITKYLKNVVSSKVRTCILDGEMLAWDPILKTPCPFGSLKDSAAAEKKDFGSTWPLFVIFDIVYLNRSSLVPYPLSQRKSALKKIITPCPSHIEVISYEEGSTANDIQTHLNNAIASSTEGIMIKNPKSIYSFGVRNENWIKVKPEYIDEYSDSLDCIVIGATYGQGYRRDILASFICALRVPFPSSPVGFKFISFCRVGGGFSSNEYKLIQHMTEGHWNKFIPNKFNDKSLTEFPFSLVDFGNIKKIDVWIDPRHSIVLEIKASQIVPSTTFRAGITLRFPRFKLVREDKNYENCLTLDELRNLDSEIERKKRAELLLAKKNKKNVNKRKLHFLNQVDYDDNNKEDSTKDKWIHDKIKVFLKVPTYSDIKPLDFPLFEGLVFYIISGVHSKSSTSLTVKETMSIYDLKKIVKSYGGEVIEYLDQCRRSLIIIADQNNVTVESLKVRFNDMIDIINPNWIFDCLLEHSLVPYEPRNLFYSTTETKSNALSRVDPFGDSYTRPITVSELKEILNSVKETPIENLPLCKDSQEFSDFSEEYKEFVLTRQTEYGDKVKGEIFLGTATYFYSSLLSPHFETVTINDYDDEIMIAITKYKVGDGSFVNNLQEDFITHIVFPNDTDKHEKSTFINRLLEINSEKFGKIHFVSISWILDSWDCSQKRITETLS